MASVNKVILVGNLGQDPETRYSQDGAAITNVSIATTDKWKDKSTGQMKQHTEWHRVVFFNRLAEIVNEYLKKGSAVYIEGKLRTRKWEDKDGNEKYTTEIVAEQMQMLGSRDSQDAEKPAKKQAVQPRRQPIQQMLDQISGGIDELDDDIPF